MATIAKCGEINRYEGTGRMSRAVVYNGTIHLCGQVSRSEGGIQAQTKEILANIETLLEKYGSDKTRILSALIHITDMANFAAMNEVWDGWMEKGIEPARTCVEAKLASPELFVEITVTAAVKE